MCEVLLGVVHRRRVRRNVSNIQNVAPTKCHIYFYFYFLGKCILLLLKPPIEWHYY